MIRRPLHDNDDQSESRLIELVRGGDTRAFAILVSRYEETVAGVVTGMLGPGPEAEDVGQETFVRFWKALGDFRGEASVKTYLTRIAINLSLNALKRKKKHRKRFESWPEGNPVHEPSITDKMEIESGEMRSLVRHALGGLEPKHRSVIILRLMEGYSTRETAEILRIPEGTVLSRLARAKDNLKQFLEPFLKE